MTLRLRLALALAYLIALLVAGAAVAAIGFQSVALDMRDVLGQTRAGNESAIELLDAFENVPRMHPVGGNESGGSGAVDAWNDAFARARLSAAESPEKLLALDEVESRFQRFRAASASASAVERALPAPVQHDRVEQARLAVRDGILDFFRVQQRSTLEASAEVLDDADAAAVGLGLFAALAIVSAAWLFRALRRSLLDELEELQAAAADVRAGERNRRARVMSRDELGDVARCLNEALDARAEVEAEVRSSVSELRAVVVALLRRWPTPAAIVHLDGELAASTLTAEQEQAVRNISPLLRRAAGTLLARRFVEPDELVTDVRLADGRILHLQALTSYAAHVVGWFASIEESGKHGGTATLRSTDGS